MVVETYRVIQGDHADELSRRVCTLMAQGWQPIGGVSMVRHENDGYTYWSFYQAMVKQPEIRVSPPIIKVRADNGEEFKLG